MPPDRKEAAEKLRQLVNSNLKNEIEVSVSYDICLLKTDLRSSSYHKRRYNICSGNTYQAGESNHSNY